MHEFISSTLPGIAMALTVTAMIITCFNKKSLMKVSPKFGYGFALFCYAIAILGWCFDASSVSAILSLCMGSLLLCFGYIVSARQKKGGK